MANHDDDDDADFNFYPEHSTTGIFYREDGINGLQHCICWHPTPLPLPLPPPIYLQSTVCSSSQGLVLCRDFLLNYYVGNPWIEDMNSYVHLPNPPRYHPPDSTHIVLATNFFPDVPPVFDVICAIDPQWCDKNLYTFDSYSSDTGTWFSLMGINLQERRIVPHTGVSCGRCAYWLTEMPCSILRYNVMGATVMQIVTPLEFPRPVNYLPNETIIQLGRAGYELGLVISDQAALRVEVYGLLEFGIIDYGWFTSGFFSFELQDDEIWDGMFHNGTIMCREMPRPIRFESFKLELLFWVDDQLMLIENSAGNDRHKYHFRRCRFGNMPASVTREVPCVCTSLLPEDFIQDQD